MSVEWDGDDGTSDSGYCYVVKEGDPARPWLWMIHVLCESYAGRDESLSDEMGHAETREEAMREAEACLLACAEYTHEAEEEARAVEIRIATITLAIASLLRSERNPLAYFRHSCTNYDALLHAGHRYSIIKERVNEMAIQALHAAGITDERGCRIEMFGHAEED